MQDYATEGHSNKSCSVQGLVGLQAELRYAQIEKDCLKGHCIEFKYYADGTHSGLTPPS